VPWTSCLFWATPLVTLASSLSGGYSLEFSFPSPSSFQKSLSFHLRPFTLLCQNRAPGVWYVYLHTALFYLEMFLVREWSSPSSVSPGVNVQKCCTWEMQDRISCRSSRFTSGASTKKTAYTGLPICHCLIRRRHGWRFQLSLQSPAKTYPRWWEWETGRVLILTVFSWCHNHIIVGLHPQSPRHLAWQPRTRVSLVLLFFPIHVIAATT